MGRLGSRQDGQAAPEYVAAVLLVAALMVGLLGLAGPSVPGGGVARALAAKLVCAVDGGHACGGEAGLARALSSPLERAYGSELASMLAERAPDVFFEDGDFVSLPVDYRDCRKRSCADSIRHGALSRTQTGLQPVAFTHVVDCRHADAASREGYECSGERMGNVYLQYWLYYPDSATHGLGRAGYHVDDWESYQVRIDSGGSAMARASSHHGYNGRRGGFGSLGSDTGIDPQPGWDTILNALHVAAGSHAGMSQGLPGDTRHIPREALRLIPLEPIARSGGTPEFSVSPPWEKGVWRDPESMGT